MAKIPVRFKRVAAAFDEVAKVRLCGSSGSEHSPESSTDLSDLVKSFMEKDQLGGGDERILDWDDERGCESGYWCDFENRENLRGLFESYHDDGNDERLKIYEEIESAIKVLGDMSSPSFKRTLMAHLRDLGFDAGLCKSRWEKTGRFPAGTYEYIDINKDKTRYIIEVNLAREFEIARGTDSYQALLDIFPTTYVGKSDELKKIVRQMCAAMKETMKNVDMHMPPWRRNGYMQAKWFSAYKRTTNAVATTKVTKVKCDAKKSSIGFVASHVRTYCRPSDGFSGRIGLKMGHLTAVFAASEEVGV